MGIMEIQNHQNVEARTNLFPTGAENPVPMVLEGGGGSNPGFSVFQ